MRYFARMLVWLVHVICLVCALHAMMCLSSFILIIRVSWVCILALVHRQYQRVTSGPELVPVLPPQAVIDVLEVIWFRVWILRGLQVDAVEQ